MSEPKPKKSLKERFKWFGPPPGGGHVWETMKDGYQGAASGIRSLRPRRFDRRGFFGRDPDGGIERFRMMARGMSARDIEQALFVWERNRGLFKVAAAGFLTAIPLAALYGFLTIHFAIGLVVGALLMGSKALVADFRAWQIQQGRFGAPAEYLNHHLPRNMQIMDKGDRP